MEMRTKRLPISLSFGDFKCGSDEFLIPFLKKEDQRDGFMGIKSGFRIPFGVLSFIGKSISANDILKSINISKTGGIDVPSALRLLDNYLEILQTFRLGNVLNIIYLSGDNIQLLKVADRPPRENGPKLP